VCAKCDDLLNFEREQISMKIHLILIFQISKKRKMCALNSDLQRRMEFLHFTFTSVQITRHETMVSRRRYKSNTFQEHLLKNIRSERELRHKPNPFVAGLDDKVKVRSHSKLLDKRPKVRVCQLEAPHDDDVQIFVAGDKQQEHPVFKTNKIKKVESAFDVLVDAIEKEKLRQSLTFDEHDFDPLRESKESISLNESPKSSVAAVEKGGLSLSSTPAEFGVASFTESYKMKKSVADVLRRESVEDLEELFVDSYKSTNAKSIARSAPIAIPKVAGPSASAMARSEVLSNSGSKKIPVQPVASSAGFQVKRNQRKSIELRVDPIAVAKQTLIGVPFCDLMFE
jgi:hypothetical protein